MAKLIGNRYASSLFEVGLELNKIDKFQEELGLINNILKLETKIFEILTHPRISKDEKKSLVEEIFKDRVSKEVLNFLFIIVDKRREIYLIDIIKEYESIYNEYKDILKVVAVTAVPMEEESKKKLEIVLENKFNKKVQLANEVDSSIIGGVLLKMDGRVMDSTLTSQLKKMENEILNVSLR